MEKNSTRVRFAKSYIDRLFAEEDMPLLDHLISVVGAERQLREEFWLFRHVLWWVGATRSGIWQCYENLSADDYHRIIQALRKHGMNDVAEKYRFGWDHWTDPEQIATLDKWIDDHAKELEHAAFNVIAAHKDELF